MDMDAQEACKQEGLQSPLAEFAAAPISGQEDFLPLPGRPQGADAVLSIIAQKEREITRLREQSLQEMYREVGPIIHAHTSPREKAASVVQHPSSRSTAVTIAPGSLVLHCFPSSSAQII